MAKEKPGMMIYFDLWLSLFDDYSPEEIGLLLQAAIAYATTGEITEFEDRAMKTAFRAVRRNVDLDSLRYDKAIAQRRYAAYCRQHGYDKSDPNKPSFDDFTERIMPELDTMTGRQ